MACTVHVHALHCHGRGVHTPPHPPQTHIHVPHTLHDNVRVSIKICTYNNIPYSRKIWRGIKFGGLAVYITTAKIKNPSKFPSRIYTYGDPVPNRQI